jgi:DNA helicase II / ATP-dependent DNA helicase PcrA
MKKYHLHRKDPSFTVDYEKDLNPEQYIAVMHESGPALVLAGAGTGKTRVVTFRVARIIEAGTRPENVLLLTFTNKAAKEMMRRAEKLIGRNVIGLLGGTFHHVANLILRQHYLLAGYRQGFSILDREDSRELFESCISEICKRKVLLPRGIVLSEICSLSKNTGMGTGDIVIQRFPHFLGALDGIEKAVSLYENKKRSLNLMDFDDLLVAWRNIFKENETLREYYSLKFIHILVDEYQDTNKLQAEIIDLMSGGIRNLMVVGDDAQSIYSFRGADFENILRFPERHPDAVIFQLTTNYRSTPEILNLANKIMTNNKKQFTKELHAVAPPGEPPNVVPLKDVFQEAEFVASVIMDLNSDGVSLEDVSVLYRSHYQSMEIQMEFQRRGIPFEVRSGLKFFEQAHIKDILSYLKVMVNPYDEISWKRILKLIRGIGNATAGKLWEQIYASGSPLDSLSGAHGLIPKKSLEGFGLFVSLLERLRDEKYHSPSGAIDYALRQGYEDYLYSNYPNADMRIEDIEQMARFALRYDSNESFLSDLALQGVTDTETQDADGERGKVVLSTVHQAKGLEWEVVFIIGMNDGKFPSSKSLKNGDEEEERRLFYVGVTRAKGTLFLCYPIDPGDRYAPGFLRPSRFLREIPRNCFEEIAVEDV